LSVLQHVTSGDYKQFLIKSATHICHNDGIEVVIDGIEDVKDKSLSDKVEIDYLQGNLLCSPKQRIENCEYLCQEGNKCTRGYKN